MSVIKYVVGFLYTNDGRDVVLIRKNRPEWQNGKLNGVGGHIEETDESPAAAMSREFYEETGVTVPQDEWNQFAVLRDPKVELYFFRAFSDLARQVKTVTDEQIYLMPSEHLPNNIIPNLKYLIPMSLNSNIVESDIRCI